MANYATGSVSNLLAEESLDSESVPSTGGHHQPLKHRMAEDPVGAHFDRVQGTKAKRDEAAGEGTSRHFEKRKNNKCKGGEYVAAVERKPGKAPEDDSPCFFDDLLEKPCPNHARRGEQKKKPEPEDAA